MVVQIELEMVKIDNKYSTIDNFLNPSMGFHMINLRRSSSSITFSTTYFTFDIRINIRII